jgi:cbb3-type cytochrome oxidase subunit 3
LISLGLAVFIAIGVFMFRRHRKKTRDEEGIAGSDKASLVRAREALDQLTTGRGVHFYWGTEVGRMRSYRGDEGAGNLKSFDQRGGFMWLTGVLAIFHLGVPITCITMLLSPKRISMHTMHLIALVASVLISVLVMVILTLSFYLCQSGWWPGNPCNDIRICMASGGPGAVLGATCHGYPATAPTLWDDSLLQPNPGFLRIWIWSRWVLAAGILSLVSWFAMAAANSRHTDAVLDTKNAPE